MLQKAHKKVKFSLYYKFSALQIYKSLKVQAPEFWKFHQNLSARNLKSKELIVTFC